MSRFLRGKKEFMMKGAILLFLLLLCFLRMYIVAILLIVSFIINKKVYLKIRQPLLSLGPKRPVEKIETLIIGNNFSLKILKAICRFDKALILTSPNRSLYASSMILYHTESILQDGGRVIIIASKRKKEKVDMFDIPLISRVSALEEGLNRYSRINKYPFFIKPLKSILFLLGIACKNTLKMVECPDKELMDFCIRKNFELIYLV